MLAEGWQEGGLRRGLHALDFLTNLPSTFYLTLGLPALDFLGNLPSTFSPTCSRPPAYRALQHSPGACSSLWHAGGAPCPPSTFHPTCSRLFNLPALDFFTPQAPGAAGRPCRPLQASYGVRTRRHVPAARAGAVVRLVAVSRFLKFPIQNNFSEIR